MPNPTGMVKVINAISGGAAGYAQGLEAREARSHRERQWKRQLELDAIAQQQWKESMAMQRQGQAGQTGMAERKWQRQLQMDETSKKRYREEQATDTARYRTERSDVARGWERQEELDRLAKGQGEEVRAFKQTAYLGQGDFRPGSSETIDNFTAIFTTEEEGEKGKVVVPEGVDMNDLYEMQVLPDDTAKTVGSKLVWKPTPLAQQLIQQAVNEEKQAAALGKGGDEEKRKLDLRKKYLTEFETANDEIDRGLERVSEFIFRAEESGREKHFVEHIEREKGQVLYQISRRTQNLPLLNKMSQDQLETPFAGLRGLGAITQLLRKGNRGKDLVKSFDAQHEKDLTSYRKALNKTEIPQESVDTLTKNFHDKYQHTAWRLYKLLVTEPKQAPVNESKDRAERRTPEVTPEGKRKFFGESFDIFRRSR